MSVQLLYMLAAMYSSLQQRDMPAHIAEKTVVHSSMISVYQRRQQTKKEEKLVQLNTTCVSMQHDITIIKTLMDGLSRYSGALILIAEVKNFNNELCICQ